MFLILFLYFMMPASYVHAITIFHMQFFLVFLLKLCITLSIFFHLNKMQLYRNCDASKNSKLLGAIEMKGIEKN